MMGVSTIVALIAVNDILLFFVLITLKVIDNPFGISFEKTMWTKTFYGLTFWFRNKGKTVNFRNYKKLDEYDRKVFRYFSHGGCTVVNVDIEAEYKKNRRMIDKAIKGSEK
jgi:hypothetical protein